MTSGVTPSPGPTQGLGTQPRVVTQWQRDGAESERERRTQNRGHVKPRPQPTQTDQELLEGVTTTRKRLERFLSEIGLRLVPSLREAAHRVSAS
jgi:hypothetical protein